MTRLMWVDLETTGLDPTNDRILEVAWGFASLHDPFVVSRWFTRVLHWDLNIRSLDPAVQKMHTKNGLFDLCRETPPGENRFRARDEILETIPFDTESLILAGNTVSFDRSFLVSWMPLLEGRFSHKLYDVSSIRLFCQSLGMPKIPKPLDEPHRALPDIQSSVEQAKLCMEWLREESAWRVASGCDTPEEMTAVRSQFEPDEWQEAVDHFRGIKDETR